jgi:hypothetical protein
MDSLDTLPLKAPSSLAERWDIAILTSDPTLTHRAGAAALGLCWEKFRRFHRYNGRALDYSTTVLDTLLGQGYKFSDIAVAGQRALVLCMDGLVAVEGAETFSEPPAAGSTAGGASNEAS